jgi:hypothetical protein
VSQEITPELRALVLDRLYRSAERDARELLEEAETWRDAAIQAKNDLRAIEEAFRASTPIGEDGPNPPIGPGCTFAEWTSPANTMRWIESLEAGTADTAPTTAKNPADASEPHQSERAGSEDKTDAELADIAPAGR